MPRLSDMRWCPVLKISIKQSSWGFISNIRNFNSKAAIENLQVFFKNVFPTNTTPMLSSSAEILFLQNHLYAPTSNLMESIWKTYQICWLLCLHWHHFWAVLTHVSCVTALETPCLLKLICFLQYFSMFFVKIIGPLKIVTPHRNKTCFPSSVFVVEMEKLAHSIFWVNTQTNIFLYTLGFFRPYVHFLFLFCFVCF